MAVSPDDERYRSLVGAEVALPLTGRRIPVVADTGVDAEFGTGMVKVTPAHDANDFEIAGRTGLPLLDVMTPDAKMNENAPEAFRKIAQLVSEVNLVEHYFYHGVPAREGLDF